MSSCQGLRDMLEDKKEMQWRSKVVPSCPLRKYHMKLWCAVDAYLLRHRGVDNSMSPTCQADRTSNLASNVEMSEGRRKQAKALWRPADTGPGSRGLSRRSLWSVLLCLRPPPSCVVASLRSRATKCMLINIPLWDCYTTLKKKIAVNSATSVGDDQQTWLEICTSSQILAVRTK